MIEYINARLNGWAAWSKDGKRNCLGFPKQVAFARLMPRTGGGPLVPYLNEDAAEIDEAVHALPEDMQELVVEFYFHDNPACDKAKRLGCCRDTLYTRLHKVHVRIMEWLQDQDDRAERKNLLTATPTLS